MEGDEDGEDGATEGFDKWGELDGDADTTEEATRRLAVCNMDWDRVQAEDIFLVSFNDLDISLSVCPSALSLTFTLSLTHLIFYVDKLLFCSVHDGNYVTFAVLRFTKKLLILA